MQCVGSIIGLDALHYGMDFGKLFGDDMVDGDLAAFDGMGMGGEFQNDSEEAEMAFDEGEMAIDQAMMDGEDSQERGETKSQSEEVAEFFGVDPDKGLYE